ncbi:MAG: DUF1549 domain-containing protein [Planctomycetes bacterium]|nr:DUF1549 domain-containing protein [Planctomycetota bacterium]
MRLSSARMLSSAIVVAVFFVAEISPLSATDVSFSRDVMAVLSKAGCNMGTCHGNQNGKGGFKLSLRGENPDADFVTLTHEQVGRRVNTVHAESSLLLLKPTMSVPHEGGKRFNEDSPEYALLRQWIAAGMPKTSRNEPALQTLLVTPLEQSVVEPADSVRLQAIAKFADGSTRDVTRLACFDAAQPNVTISVDAVVRRERFGEVTVVARYLDQQVPVSLAFLPARPGFVATAPPPTNFIDEHVFAKLQSLRMNPSEVCDDATFLRRVSLDLLGLPPTAVKSRQFAQDQRLDKRPRLVDELLTRPEFADFWALKWADLLRVEEKTLDRKGVATFHAWIRDGMATNKPLDIFVRELIVARGSTYEQPASNFYRAMRDPIIRAETVAQVFLGTRLQCAKCHNHPFDRWTQADYYGWANQFSQIKYEVLENNRRDRNDSHEFDGEQLVLIGDGKEVEHPGTGKPVKPRLLGTRNSEFETSSDRLMAVADWLTAPTNRRFAEAQVNRVWFHLLGRGIVEPIDDFRATNPASNPALLAALTDDFVMHRFDVQHLIRTIMASRTYQLSSAPNDTNRDDESNFSHAVIRRLSAEQLADSFSEVLGAKLEFNGYPSGTRASQLAGVRTFRRRDSAPSSGDQLLTMFGKPPRLQACECERADDPTLSQTLQLVSGPILNEVLARSDNRLRDWLESKVDADAVIDDVFWTILNRAPSATELAAAMKHLASSDNRRVNLEDVVWSLMSSPEFVLRH